MITASSKSLQLAQAYINRLIIAGATVSDAQRAAITALAQVIHAIGVTKFAAVYPFVGGSAAAHALDLMGLYNITWSGTVTHNSNGITGDASSGYGNTGWNPSTHLASIDDAGLSVYSRTASTPAGARIEMGCGDATNSFNLHIRRPDTDVIHRSFTATAFTVSSLTLSGMFTAVRRGTSDLELYRNGSSVGTSSTASVGTINQPVYVGAMNSNGSPANYSDTNLAFAAIHLGLTDQQAADLSAGVVAFQTALSRNV